MYKTLLCYPLLLWDLCLFTLFTNSDGESPIHQRKLPSFKFCVMSQRGILYKRLESLDRWGILSTITEVCNALDGSVKRC